MSIALKDLHACLALKVRLLLLVLRSASEERATCQHAPLLCAHE